MSSCPSLPSLHRRLLSENSLCSPCLEGDEDLWLGIDFVSPKKNWDMRLDGRAYCDGDDSDEESQSLEDDETVRDGQTDSQRPG